MLALGRLLLEREPVRLAELAALFAAGSAPDLVAGDFNAVSGSAVYGDMVERGFVDCGRHLTSGDAKRIDYIWIRADSGLAASAYEVIEDERLCYEAGLSLSDHPPVCARLQLAG